MISRIVILGGGTGGTLAANRLRRELGASCQITVVDTDGDHVYQPGLLFVPFARVRPDRLARPRARQLRRGISYHQCPADHVDIGARQVHLADGTVLPYDALVIASGAALLPGETEGLPRAMAQGRAFTFYDLAGAVALREALAGFSGGRIAVNVVDLPIKCPVAPLEFCFLADTYFRQRGIRDRVELTLVTPLDGAFTRAIASRELGGLLDRKGIGLVTEFNTGEVDASAGRLVSFDGRDVSFDLAVVVPIHGGQPYVGRSPGLGDALGFVPVDEHTLQSKASPDIFAIGDAADLRASKAGSVAHFEGEILAANIASFLAGQPLSASFDGHTNCFIESGAGKALLIDFNYATEPVPGHFPGPIGLPLLKESRLNHAGKLAFQWLYWHMLLPGRDIPGIPAGMTLAGKHVPAAGPDHQVTS
ncbi:MAG TPA: FAD/NAD(P)-binding oxidoreductase [Streptosporangiaceae bacterium]